MLTTYFSVTSVKFLGRALNIITHYIILSNYGLETYGLIFGAVATAELFSIVFKASLPVWLNRYLRYLNYDGRIQVIRVFWLFLIVALTLSSIGTYFLLDGLKTLEMWQIISLFYLIYFFSQFCSATRAGVLRAANRVTVSQVITQLINPFAFLFFIFMFLNFGIIPGNALIQALVAISLSQCFTASLSLVILSSNIKYKIPNDVPSKPSLVSIIFSEGFKQSENLLPIVLCNAFGLSVIAGTYRIYQLITSSFRLTNSTSSLMIQTSTPILNKKTFLENQKLFSLSGLLGMIISCGILAYVIQNNTLTYGSIITIVCLITLGVIQNFIGPVFGALAITRLNSYMLTIIITGLLLQICLLGVSIHLGYSDLAIILYLLAATLKGLILKRSF